MASGFFAVFDDIAVLLDDLAAMSKIATKKTAGILGGYFHFLPTHDRGK